MLALQRGRTGLDSVENKVKTAAGSVNNLHQFVQRTIAEANLQVEPLPVGDDGAWSLVDGCLRHRTGRFFEIGAVAFTNHHGQRIEQPMILQPEIGTLGFLIHRSELQTRVLVNAKVEPGNVGECQLAPSCQATLSNQQRAHGGAPTPCYSPFANPAPNSVLADTLQSEQGTRFWKKRNRNVIVELDDQQMAALPVPWTHTWVTLDELLQALLSDFSINTDARSVLVCSDWSRLIGRVPFGVNTGDAPLTKACRESFHFAEDVGQEVQGALDLLKHARSSEPHSVQKVSLDDVTGWHRVDNGYRSDNRDFFDITHYGVEVRGREVPVWQQPFVESRSPGFIILCCAVVNRIPRFLFRVTKEIGLGSGAELTPGLCIEPGGSIERISIADHSIDYLQDIIKNSGMIWLESKQSEEGGRFFLDVNHYQIVYLDKDVPALSDDFIWLSLQAVQQLVVRREIFTNEARSVLSYLLAHA